jgi:hypothetical protein
LRITVCNEKLTHKIFKEAFAKKSSGQPIPEREKMALIRYHQELKGDKPELSKKTTLDVSITLNRHNLNFDMGKLLQYSWSVSTGFRVTQSGFLSSFNTDK